MRLFFILVFTFGLASPLCASDGAKLRSQKLDSLFGELHNAKAPELVSKIQSDIWAIWAHNDSATAEQLLRQGVAAMNAHEYSAAEQTLIQLVESYPDFAEGWNKRATLYFMDGRYDASLVDIEHVLELEPRHFGALAGKAMILRMQKRTGEAIKVLKETLTINPHMQSVIQAIKDLEKSQPDI